MPKRFHFPNEQNKITIQDFEKLRSDEEKKAYVSTRVSFRTSCNTWHTHLLPVDDTRFSIESAEDYTG